MRFALCLVVLALASSAWSAQQLYVSPCYTIPNGPNIRVEFYYSNNNGSQSVGLLFVDPAQTDTILFPGNPCGAPLGFASGYSMLYISQWQADKNAMQAGLTALCPQVDILQNTTDTTLSGQCRYIGLIGCDDWYFSFHTPILEFGCLDQSSTFDISLSTAPSLGGVFPFGIDSGSGSGDGSGGLSPGILAAIIVSSIVGGVGLIVGMVYLVRYLQHRSPNDGLGRLFRA